MTEASVAIVTGSSGGIGSAIVADLTEHGWRVVGFGRSLPSAPVAGADYRLVDVSHGAEVTDAVMATADAYGRIDALVTSAAVLRTAPLHATSDELWDEVVGVNLRGVFLACRAVLPAMLAARSGSIVNLSSVHAIATVPGTAAYAATKGAIVSLTRQIAVEYADAGIRANSLVVGSVDTRMTTQHREQIERDGVEIRGVPGEIGRMAQPAEIARTVRFLIDAEASFITGSAITIDGGLLSRLM